MIEGRLVRLRPIGRADLPLLRRWFADPATVRHWGKPVPLVTEDQFEADLAGRFARFDETGYFVIEVREGPVIGRIEFEGLSMESRSAEIMILIGEPAARGKGYGADALVAMLSYLFGERNLHRAGLTVLAWNERAIRSYEKVGFRVEGRLRDDLYRGGRYHDQIAMSILRPEFEAHRPRSEPDEPATQPRSPGQQLAPEGQRPRADG